MYNRIYNAMDIAIYTINCSQTIKTPITNLKLQKILYYIQAKFLVKEKRRCFIEPILHWKHGPVVRNVYDKFSKYQDREIDYQDSVEKIVLEDGLLKIKSVPINDVIHDKDKRIIDELLIDFSIYDAWYLVDRTHQEEPWQNTKANEEITPESIRRYFTNHEERLNGQFH